MKSKIPFVYSNFQGSNRSNMGRLKDPVKGLFMSRLKHSNRSYSGKDPEDIIDPRIFKLTTLEVARSLLGSLLCRRFEDGKISTGTIVEVEAYTKDDPACHAYRGLTERTKPMFGPPGHAYVYFIYGMYHCLNVVTEPDGQAGAILIRSLDGEGTNGPGKICRQWSIDKSHNQIDMTQFKSPIWLAKGESLTDDMVETTPRIGISKATDRPWRFIIKNHPALSKGSKPKVKRR